MAEEKVALKTAELPFRHWRVEGEIFPPMIGPERMVEAKSFALKPDDLFIVTYPKCGTTWTQRIVQLIRVHGDAAKDPRSVVEAIPWFEKEPQADMDALPQPRTFKSHSPLRLLVRSPDVPCKYICVARNPFDCCVSMYFHMSGWKGFEYEATWGEYFDAFMDGLVESGDFFDHVLPFWEQSKTDDNMLFVKYEDLKKDSKAEIRRIAEFIGVHLLDDEVAAVAQLSQFDKMKGDEKANYSWSQERRKAGSKPFLRKGQVGDWKNHFDAEQQQRLEAKYQARTKDTGLSFDFEL